MFGYNYGYTLYKILEKQLILGVIFILECSSSSRKSLNGCFSTKHFSNTLYDTLQLGVMLKCTKNEQTGL